MHIFKLLIGIIVLILVFTFSIKNMENVSIQYFNWQSGPVPLFLVALASLITGAILAWLFELFERLRLHKLIRKQKKEIARLETELKKQGGGVSLSTGVSKKA
ncbi:MAG: lipopolysaccharide assembly LapA domain-containing protein [Nitrospinota bacterium]